MEDIYGLKPLLTVPFPWVPFLLLLGLLLALLLGGWWLVARWLKKRHQPAPHMAPALKVSPREEALQALQELERSQLLQRGDAKGFYLQLEAILRGYLQGTWQLPARSYTRSQLSSLFSQHYPEGWADYGLQTLTLHAQQAKFARQEVTSEQMTHDFEQLNNFVKQANLPKTIAPAAQQSS